MDIKEILLMIPGIILGFSLHEYAHAQVAVWLGDDTPRIQGRLSTSPLVHIDLIGFILILIAGFGWAKPVQINSRNFKNPKRDDILVSLAGPFMNLMIAVIFLGIMKLIYFLDITFLSDNLYYSVMELLDYTVLINIVLFIFNLLPIPPLDGSHILFGILGLKEKGFYYQIYTKGRFILLVLILTNALDYIIGIPVSRVYNSLIHVFF